MKTMIIVEGFNHSESENQKNHSADGYDIKYRMGKEV